LPSRFRVPLGYVAFVLVLALARPDLRSVALGFALAVPGEALRLWASGHIEKTRTLATGGPYAYTRNPLYFGSMLMTLGVAIASGSGWSGIVLAVYVLACYPTVMTEEAAFLKRTFPEYADWARDVPVFVPRLSPAGPRGTRFEWGRVVRNREWRAALAFPGLAVLFYLRHLMQ
jgi:protein-S-isoprenylcysteine O-methyltransferase Ste14